jgi:rubrerythrin
LEGKVIAFKDLKDILKISIKWEQNLKNFYDVAEFALQKKESKKVLAMLKENLLKRLEILKNINIENYGKTSWVRYAADYKDDELIPIHSISRDASPQEIFTQILNFETKMKDFYSTIFSKLVPSKQRELFESLVKFKEEQIYEINNFMKTYVPEK